MAAFPNLSSGAVAQYPFSREETHAVRVLRFVDGTEQRFRNSAGGLRRWVLRLDLLNDAELHELEVFVESNAGGLNDFTFTDPWDGVEYPSCRIEGSDFVANYIGEGRGAAVVRIRENR